MFEDEYKKANERLCRSGELDAKVLDAMHSAEAGEKKTTRKLSKGAMVALAAAFGLLFIAPSVIGITKLASGVRGGSDQDAKTAGIISLLTPDASSGAANAADYKELYDRMRKRNSQFIYYSNGGIFYEAMEIDVPTADGVLDEPTYAPSPADSDHSQTNTQVEGVDEADIVKTDGKYIYVLNGSGVTVLSAAGKDTEKLAFIPAEEMPKHSNEAKTYFSAMYLSGSKLVVIANESVYGSFNGNIDFDIAPLDDYFCYSYYTVSSLATVYVYDVADPASPELISTLCMDGYYNDSRLTSDMLYVISNYYPTGSIVYDEPCTYVPCTYNDEGECSLTPIGDIYYTEDEDPQSSYCYVCALDLNAPDEFSGSLAVLGAIRNVYCSTSNLYLASNEWVQNDKEIKFDVNEQTGEISIVDNGGREGVLTECKSVTELFKIRLGKQPELVATNRIDGSLLNQFSMDEYNGYLRVVTDRSTDACITCSEAVVNYEDGDGSYSTDWYYPYNDIDDNALFVLDASLNVVGKIEDIGVDEHVKSVRFMGDVGYVVTFRQTDPLFSLDLSVPSQPTIVGELHIPGFSEYMHSWNSDLLFGLGQMADEHTGGTQGLKLTMFDVSDISNVREFYTKAVNRVDYSAAEYDHKLILVAPDKGLIGFPVFKTDSGGNWKPGYCIYSFDEVNGFTEKVYIDLSSAENMWSDSMTGLYIGDVYYIIAADGSYERSEVCVFALDMNTFESLGTFVFTD